MEGGRAHAHCAPISAHDDAPCLRSGEAVPLPLSDFDAVWMRKDPPFDKKYLFSTYILDLAGPGTQVFNDPTSLKCANEKMYALNWSHLCPPTLATNRVDEVRRFAQDFEAVVLKPWDGMAGKGVLLSAASDPNLNAMAEILTEGGTFCLVQRYIPEIAEGDKRIILVDGVARGWFSRIPGDQDHRGNMHVGARVVACELSDRDRLICEEIGPRLKEDGLLFVGIDVIGDFLTEINVTSPTGLREIERLQGRNLASEILDCMEARRVQKQA